METFGEVIRNYRVQKEMTLRELSERVGVSPSFISMMENNKNLGTASEETICKMASVLGINELKLLNLAEKVPEKELVQLKQNALAFFRDDLQSRKSKMVR